MMFKNYLKITLRHLQRQKVYSFINLAGLAIGMACAILILLWVRNELSFDRFHGNAKNIYRVVSEWRENSTKSAKTPGRLAPTIKAEIPEIVNAARVLKGSRSAFQYGDKAFYEEAFFSVDPAFFEMFSFNFIKGDPATVLSDKRALVITEALAKKYFGDEAPIGKTLNWNNWQNYQVTGVLRDVPENSHLQFDFLDSHQLGEQFWPGGYNWGNFIHETYVQLQDRADPQQAGEKITAVLLKNFPRISPYLKRLYLQPLADIHLDAEVTDGHTVLGDMKYVYLFALIAGFVLLIACINFMNLSTARSLQRAKEVGMRRVAGASRLQLIGQFYGESILLASIALFLALLLAELFLPAFNQLAGKNLAMDYHDPRLVLGFTAIILVTGLVAGSYPALYLSSFKPVKVLKGMMESGTQGSRFRKALVVMQFSLSVILMSGAAVVYQQLDYMRNKKLGFEKENLVYIPAKDNAGAKYEAFKNELLQVPNILGVTAQGSLPMFSLNSSTVSWEGKDPSIEQVMENKAIDYNFVALLNLKIVEGRNFSTTHPTDAKEAFIINEEAARVMGMSSAVGKRIVTAGREGAVIGVVKDAHFKSLHHKIQPQIFYVLTDFTSEVMNLYGIVLIKINGTDIPKTIAAIANVWKRVNPNTPFEYHFLDETIDRQYAAEKKISAMANYFTVLAIAISCLGLFGLAAFAAERRTKEIGVRKVLGATVANIVAMLSRDFVKLVLVANLIAWPVAYFAMNKWLQNFAYRIDLGWWVFVLAGGMALFIALLTVSTQAIRAALVNPVEALRYE